MNKKSKYIVLILVGLVLVFSLVQTFQIEILKDNLNSVDFGEASNSVQNTLSSSYDSGSSGTPTMVGGC